MSQQKPSTTITRRALLEGTAAGVAATTLAFGLGTPATAAIRSASEPVLASGNADLCRAHHQELSTHLKSILNSAYVDERMKNKVMSTTTCPHCRVGIAPDMMDRASFAAL